MPRSALASVSYSSYLHLKSRTCTSSQFQPNPPLSAYASATAHMSPLQIRMSFNTIQKKQIITATLVILPYMVLQVVLTESHVPHAAQGGRGEYASNITQLCIRLHFINPCLTPFLAWSPGKACRIANLIWQCSLEK